MAKDSKVQVMSLPKLQPTLRLDEDDLPAIKDWKVGESYEITVKVKMTGANVGSDYDDNQGKPTHSATFKVLSANTDDGEDAKDNKQPRSAMTSRLKEKASSYK